MSLSEYLESNGIRVEELEGYCQQIPAQIADLKELSKNAKNILEIGFNGGHSSELFLSNSMANVFSFDLGYHGYVLNGKQFIDLKFPGRHTLIIGDSHKTINTFKSVSHIKFDLLFIDGDHSYDGALKDLMDCMGLAAPDATVIFDDVAYLPESVAEWTIGPTKAWKDMISMGKIEETGYKSYEFIGRGMVYGKYIL